MKTTRIDIQGIFSVGGKTLIDFLEYCVRSIQMDPLFIFLVQEYRYGPTTPKAVALYDIFCAPNAACRISALSSLSPYSLRIRDSVRPLKANLAEVQAGRRTPEIPSAPLLLPAKYLFDSLVCDVETGSSALRRIRRRYKPHLSPTENLSGGKMTAVQRHFVENIWQPMVRPQLVAAGFWRVSTIA